MAIEQAGLDKNYIPDKLVIRLISRYYNENITEAGKVVENILKTIHNINLSIDVVNNLLNEKLNSNITLEEVATVMQLIDSVSKRAGDIPSILKKLEEAKQNLMYEKETVPPPRDSSVSFSYIRFCLASSSFLYNIK